MARGGVVWQGLARFGVRGESAGGGKMGEGGADGVRNFAELCTVRRWGWGRGGGGWKIGGGGSRWGAQFCTIVHSRAVGLGVRIGPPYLGGRRCAGGIIFRGGCEFLGGFRGFTVGIFELDPLRGARHG